MAAHSSKMSIKLVLKMSDVVTDITEKPIAVLAFTEVQTLAHFRNLIAGLADYDFDFWDYRLSGRVDVKYEKIIRLGELDGKVALVKRVGSMPAGTTEFSSPDVTQSVREDSSELEELQEVPLVRASFESILMSEAAAKVWKDEFVRLKNWTNKNGYQDHNWRIKTWDEEADVRGHLECLECRVTYGRPETSQDKKSIANLFTNYKSKHLSQAKHRDNYCRRRKISVVGVKPADLVQKPDFDYEGAIASGLEIVQMINTECGAGEDLFHVPPVPGLSSNANKWFLYKVRCKVCGTMMDLISKKGTLGHNMRTHLVSRGHMDVVEAREQTADLALRSGKRGRPRKADERDQYPSVLRFFKDDASNASSSSGTGGCMGIDVGLSLLCWGIWDAYVEWKNVKYAVKSILNDQQGGNVWDPDAAVSVHVYNPKTDSIVHIEGLFRHKQCCWISLHGGGFENLTCSRCYAITLEDDFRGRVHREEEAVAKRGGRSTQGGMNVRYLTRPEFSAQMLSVNMKRRKERWLLALQTQRVCALSTRKRKLQDLLGVAADRKDLRLFLKNIVNGHRKGAFGGKEGLWDFLKDVGQNLDRNARGFRYSQKSKAIAQAMFQYGGRQVAHIFARNLGGPSLKTLKRDRAKFVQFRAGIRPETFREVGRILSAAKEMLGVVGDVPVMFAEDETRIKETPRWEAKYDTLIGFCGQKEGHTCEFGLEVHVGEGEDGYNNIVNTFEEYSKGMYARVVIVNPLHVGMPKLALCAISTCNKFKAEWVREHWMQLKECWDLYCRESVGPLLGHASDGDARRRKLMLEDYRGTNSSHPRYCVGWKGWPFSVAILPNGDLYGFGDQDQPHNGKKMINPLDRVSSIMALGDQQASLYHVCHVYKNYPIYEHGLNWDDVNRTDRQNWAAPQRLASEKVRACLGDLQVRTDMLHEQSLGTELYLQICADYIDIFYSQKHDLRTRVKLAGKVSWFFRLWRLWLRYGDHAVGGNVAKHTEKNMISIQAYHDVNMSCQFVVLLVCAFRDKFPHLCIPFHELGSDCCEIFFSKVGGMSGHERNYDFGSLLDSAVGLNRLAGLECGPEGLKVARSHKKQDHVWAKLHPLLEGEVSPNLFDYTEVQTNELVVVALKEGFEEARESLRKLQMSPRSDLPAARRRWWTHPWDVEVETWPESAVLAEAVILDDSEDHVEHRPSVGLGPRPIGDFDEFEDPEDDLNRTDAWLTDELIPNEILQVEGDTESVEPHSVEVDILGHEVRHVLSSVMSELTASVQSPLQEKRKVCPIVTCEGRTIYKSTLVSQLVGNPHLSKDRLTRVKQVAYYNGKSKQCDPDSVSCFVDVGSDCGIVFENANAAGPSTRSKKRTRGKGRTQAVETELSKEFWLGRITMMRQKVRGQWTRVRSAIDLLDRPTPPQGHTGSICQFQFSWYKPINLSKVEFTYNTSDLQWIDIEMVMTAVTLTMKPGVGRVYVLNRVDKQALDTYLETICRVD